MGKGEGEERGGGLFWPFGANGFAREKHSVEPGGAAGRNLSGRKIEMTVAWIQGQHFYLEVNLTISKTRN